MRIAIHQPNFFPWIGYFHKIAQCDLFVFLDDVKLPGGSSWTNRVKIASGQTSKWVTAQVDSSTRKNIYINQVVFKDSHWKQTAWNNIQVSYNKAEFWKEAKELFEPLLLNSSLNIAEYNIAAIQKISEKLSLETKNFVVASDLGVKALGTQRLVELVKAVDGDCYLSGDGAVGYQEDEVFKKNNIELHRTNFNHPIYRQSSNSFIAGLSVIDAVSNLGLRKASDLLRTGSD